MMGEYAAMFIFSGIFATVCPGILNFLPIRGRALGDNGFFHAIAGSIIPRPHLVSSASARS